MAKQYIVWDQQWYHWIGRLQVIQAANSNHAAICSSLAAV